MTTPGEGDHAEESDGKTAAQTAGKEISAPEADSEEQKPAELPADVRARLRRLDKLESRYHGMLVVASAGAHVKGREFVTDVRLHSRALESVSRCAFSRPRHRTI